jgi:uncharacterized membrane protein YhaH (DUF805 family)
MDVVTLFTSTEGRLAPKPFALWTLAVYAAGLASYELLSGAVLARASVWPFVIAQCALVCAWVALHIKRLRDAGQGPAAAVGVALVYLLAIALLLMLIAFLTNPNAVEGEQPGQAASGLLLLLALLAIVVSPDFGLFTTILKGLIVMTCLPAVISLAFSVYAGLRPRVAS